MKLEEIMIKLFNFSRPTYFKRKREQLPIIMLLEKYFTKDELKEYLEIQKINKLELIKSYTFEELKSRLDIEHYDPIKEMEDYLIVNLKYKINSSEKYIIYKNIIQKVLNENSLMDTVNDINAKEQLIEAVENYKTSIKRLESKDWKIETINFIKNYLIDDEVYLIIKYPNKFLKDT